MAREQETKDAVKLIERLIGPCEGTTVAHGWSKCRRCAALHLLEHRDAFTVRLLRAAVEAIQS